MEGSGPKMYAGHDDKTVRRTTQSGLLLGARSVPGRVGLLLSHELRAQRQSNPSEL